MAAPNQVLLGARGSEMWVKAPAPRTPFSVEGWSATTQQRNGRVVGRKSRQTHKEYELSWPTIDVEAARRLKALYYGVGGMDQLIYWLDPTIKNVLPPHWSMPALGASDGTPIYGKVRPTTEATPANSFGLPKQMAVYSGVGVSSQAKTFYVPVPSGWKVWIDVRGAASAGAFIARPYNGEAAVGSPTIVPTVAVTTAAKYATSITMPSNGTGMTLRLALGETVNGTTLPTTAKIASAIVEVLPPGKTPTWGGFVIGEGANGCEMFSPATESPSSAYYGRTSLSIKLTETGA